MTFKGPGTGSCGWPRPDAGGCHHAERTTGRADVEAGRTGLEQPRAAPRRGPQVPAQAPPLIPLRRGNSRRSPVA